MTEPNRQQLISRALDAIDREEEIAFDVAADQGMMFDNVKHMAFFVAEVANEMIDRMNKWAHLDYVTPREVSRFYSAKR